MVCVLGGAGGGVTIAEQSPLNWGHPDEISGNMAAMAIHGSLDCNNGNIYNTAV